MNATKYYKYYKLNIFDWIDDYSYCFSKINSNEPIKRIKNDIYIHPELMIYLTSSVSVDDCILYMQIAKDLNILNFPCNLSLKSNKRKINEREAFEEELSNLITTISIK